MAPFPFSNIEFFVVMVPALLLILASKRFGVTAFTWTIVVMSLVFFGWLPGLRAAYAALFLGLTLLVWAVATLRLRGVRAGTLALAIGSVIAAFVAVRLDAAGLLPRFGQQGSLLPAFGFAFFVIKAYGLLVDVAAGRVKSVALRDTLAYFAYFPTLIAGPIFRYDDFVTQLKSAPALRSEPSRIVASLPRLLLGAFKVMVVASLIEPWSIQSLTTDVLSKSVQSVYVGALAYYFFEYINFSGYSDMAVAVSRMIGLSPPENFDLPFLARNLTELWRRWHMSFAAWLRDYIYFPLNFYLAIRFRAADKRSRTACAAMAIFLTFVFCGAWHGLAIGTLLFGVLSGAVLAFEALAAGLGWTTAVGARLEATAGRMTHDTIRQIWTLHIASLTFAPVLLTEAQLAALTDLARTEAAALVYLTREQLHPLAQFVRSIL